MSENKNGPLSGIRVLDLSRILAGPFCTMNLGDMGAEIIKIEQPGKGDDTRSWGPPFAGSEAAYFLGINRNKKSVTLNLKSEEGIKILKKLLKNSDVLIENFKFGTMDNYGITDEWREKEAPQLVHCQITGYGGRGPRGKRPGYDFLLQAESGLMSITGEENGDPMKVGVALVDVCTGMNATIAILGALNSRNISGKGQKVETSLYTTSISMLVNVAANHLVSGKPARRFGNGHPNIVPYRTFDAIDGSIAIAVGNDMQFAKFASCLGRDDWAKDKRFIKNADRVINRSLIDKEIQDVIGTKKVEEWLEKLLSSNIPASAVNSVESALSDEQTIANDMVVSVNHSEAGVLKMLGVPYRFSDTPATINKAPPLLGEDNREILQSIGYDNDQIDSLIKSEVI
ncbi:MAG: CoA transferase [Hyphomicrobiales bacterium]|jgi:crotonobetainyl-CoA:carnitine CoA-transferase CaiB-like acyl-CoA transferase|nr:CoA transferase [Alphaproteobacteria bacterium]